MGFRRYMNCAKLRSSLRVDKRPRWKAMKERHFIIHCCAILNLPRWLMRAKDCSEELIRDDIYAPLSIFSVKFDLARMRKLTSALEIPIHRQHPLTQKREGGREEIETQWKFIMPSRIHIINVPKEAHQYAKHGLAKAQVVIDVAAEHEALMLAPQSLRRLLLCLACLPALPALVEVQLQQRRWPRFVGWQWHAGVSSVE